MTDRIEPFENSNSALESALTFCRQRQLTRFSILIPFSLTPTALNKLMAMPEVAEVYVRGTFDSAFGGRIRAFPDRIDSAFMKRLPRSTTVLVGGQAMIPIPAFAAALARGRAQIICRRQAGYGSVNLLSALVWFAADYVLHRIVHDGNQGIVHRIYSCLKKLPWLLKLWRFLLRGGAQPDQSGNRHGEDQGIPDSVFEQLTRAVLALRGTCDHTSRDNAILFVNDGLAAGGAERQIVNTIQGLTARGGFTLEIISQYLGREHALIFFSDQLIEAHVKLESVAANPSLAWDGLNVVPPEVGCVLAELPYDLVIEIVSLLMELRKRRPAVLHAWQDATCIRAGIAAVISGVPKIVLSCRSLSPDHFPFHRSHMRAAYLALLKVPGVTMTNNSQAGAASYTAWLGIDKDKIKVVRNGFNFSDITSERRIPAGGSQPLPLDTEVVGSVFRFTEEKRPLFWLDIAAQVATHRPRTHFIIYGDGPMRQAMIDHAKKLGISDRIQLPGIYPDIDRHLLSFDVFLLTSRVEGLPNVLIEAQHANVSVVAADVGGCRETMPPENHYLLLPAKESAKNYANHIVAILDDPKKRQRTVEAGAAFVRDNFRLERMIEETVLLYR